MHVSVCVWFTLVAAVALGSPSVQDDIRELAMLRDGGAITQAEFEEAEQKLLESVQETPSAPKGEFHRVGPNYAVAWPNVSSGNPYQLPELGPRFGPTLCNLCSATDAAADSAEGGPGRCSLECAKEFTEGCMAHWIEVYDERTEAFEHCKAEIDSGEVGIDEGRAVITPHPALFSIENRYAMYDSQRQSTMTTRPSSRSTCS